MGPGVVIFPDGFDGFNPNYCHGKPDGVFCKALPRDDAELHFFQLGERSYDDNAPLPENSPCRFKNANNEYEDGICCNGLCSPTLASSPGSVCQSKDYDEILCKGKLEGDKCDFYELGYDRTYHRIDGRCCDAIKALGGPATSLRCLRDSDPFKCGF